MVRALSDSDFEKLNLPIGLVHHIKQTIAASQGPGDAKPKDATMHWKTNQKGQFTRHESAFRDFVSEESGAKYPVEAGRYHLYINLACPWANGVFSTMKLKGLDHAISWSTTQPEFGLVCEDGRTSWVFNKEDSCHIAEAIDHVNGLESMRQVYRKAQPDFDHRFTVPVLWDKKTNTIVNNESKEIHRMFNYNFNSIAKNPDLDLFRGDLKDQISETADDWIYNNILNGVYKCGFASTQEAYEEAFDALFEALDRCEGMLEGRKWLVGDEFSYADLRLFHNLIRFDPVYVVHFKCNKKTILSYPNLSRFVRECYHTIGLKEHIMMDHIKRHYYKSHLTLNPKRFVAKGMDPWWDEPNKN